MIKWRTEKVRPTYVPTFCVGLDGMCRVLLGRCCRLIEDAVSTIYRAFIFRSAVAPPPRVVWGGACLSRGRDFRNAVTISEAPPPSALLHRDRGYRNAMTFSDETRDGQILKLDRGS